MRLNPGLPLLFLLGALLAGAAGSRRAESSAQTELQPQPQPLEYLGEWGTKGDGPGQFSFPVRMAADRTGNVFIADAGSGYIHKFSAKGEPRLSFQDDRRNIRPESVAVDEGGAIYATDARRGSVFIYLPDGDRFKELRCCRSREGALRVAVDSNGVIFAADGRALGVRQYSPRGRLIGIWRSKDSAAPTIEQVADIEAGDDGLVYVSDAASSAIHAFTSVGGYERSLRVPETEGPAKIAGIAVSGGHVFAADPQAHAVHVWTRGGEYRLRGNLDGRLRGAIGSPQDVAVAKGELLVLDSAGGRVLRFRLNL